MKSDIEQPKYSDAPERSVASFPRVILSCFLFLAVWIVVAGLMGLAIFFIFPPPGNVVEIGIGFTLRNLPGTVLGFIVACRMWRFMIDDHIARKNRQPR